MQHALLETAKDTRTDHLFATFGLPAFLGTLKAGDQVSLQIEYVDDWQEPIV
jgi:hypothetical protein